jgi:hypothetical protein
MHRTCHFPSPWTNNRLRPEDGKTIIISIQKAVKDACVASYCTAPRPVKGIFQPVPYYNAKRAIEVKDKDP